MRPPERPSRPERLHRGRPNPTKAGTVIGLVIVVLALLLLLAIALAPILKLLVALYRWALA